LSVPICSTANKELQGIHTLRDKSGLVGTTYSETIIKYLFPAN